MLNGAASSSPLRARAVPAQMGMRLFIKAVVKDLQPHRICFPKSCKSEILSWFCVLPIRLFAFAARQACAIIPEDDQSQSARFHFVLHFSASKSACNSLMQVHAVPLVRMFRSFIPPKKDCVVVLSLG